MEIEKYDSHFAEVFIKQTRMITNSEVLFEEFAIQAFFSQDDLWDPRILNEEALESSPLGSISNYRNKYLVSDLIIVKRILFLPVHTFAEIIVQHRLYKTDYD